MFNSIDRFARTARNTAIAFGVATLCITCTTDAFWPPDLVPHLPEPEMPKDPGDNEDGTRLSCNCNDGPIDGPVAPPIDIPPLKPLYPAPEGMV